MATRNVNTWKQVDWITICMYLLLVICGWFSICGASFEVGQMDFFSFDSRTGKQLIWIVCSLGLGFILLMIEDRFYELLSYPIYIAMMLLLLVTIFIAKDVKGSHSWLQLGPISLQPAEFAKFATALCLSRFIDSFGFDLSKPRFSIRLVLVILLPLFLIIAQKETGSALVYVAFFLVFYREGMPGAILFVGVSAVVYFVIGIRFQEELFCGNSTSIGYYAVLVLILFFSYGMMIINDIKKEQAIHFGFISLVILIASYFVGTYIISFNQVYAIGALNVFLIIYLLYNWVARRVLSFFFIAFFTLGSIGFLYSANYVFTDVLEYHQRTRIKVLLGMVEDIKKAGYNVNQSKIAIGSGGFSGKGFLNGTQTKLNYVPEQDTDFIFCTVGEEQGFVGSSLILLLYLSFILRLLFLAERQPTTFGRVYGYSVFSIFLFHLFINVGMVLGLTPVIGIPLPFFSYGGSSLWGFTLLLFIFLRLDAARTTQYR